MVYNRRKNPRRDRGVAGRVNPRSEWVWSSKPRHEPLTTKALFDAGTPIGKARRGSRTGGAANRHPATTRTYRLRSYVICDLCGRRLYGKTRRVGDVYSYYACEPVPAHHAGKDWFPAHQKSLWVREDKLLRLVRGFFARRIFGPDRAVLLTADRPDQSTMAAEDATRAAALREKIRDLEREQTNIVGALRDYRPTGDEDVDRQWRDQLQKSFAEIAGRRKAVQAQLAELTKRPETHKVGDPRLLERLPVLDADLGDLPEEVERELFEGFQLQVRYHHPTRRVTIRVTVDDESILRLAAAGRAMMHEVGGQVVSPDTEGPPAASAAGGPGIFSLAVSAPGGSRTHTVGGLSSVPLPVGLRGPWRHQPTY